MERRSVSSFNFCSVSRIPGATSSPSKACRADDNSPNATIISARQPISPDVPLLLSTFPLQLPRRTWKLASNEKYHSPLANTSGIKRKSHHPPSFVSTIKRGRGSTQGGARSQRTRSRGKMEDVAWLSWVAKWQDDGHPRFASS